MCQNGYASCPLPEPRPILEVSLEEVMEIPEVGACITSTNTVRRKGKGGLNSLL